VQPPGKLHFLGVSHSAVNHRKVQTIKDLECQTMAKGLDNLRYV